VIIFNFSGHGYFDLAAYEEFMGGKLQNYQHPQVEIDQALSKLPEVKL